MDELISHIKSCLKCPVCLVIPRTPHVFQCSNGHVVCQDCHARVNKCPTCRVKLAKPGKRNLFAEQVAQRFEHPCRYSDKGCGFKGAAAELPKHEVNCDVRSVACPLCRKEFHFAKMAEHWSAEHKSLIIPPNMNNAVDKTWLGLKKSVLYYPAMHASAFASMQLRIFNMYGFTLSGTDDFFMLVFARKGNSLYAWTYGCGAGADKRFEIELAAIGSNNRFGAAQTCKVYGIDKKLDDVVADPDCLVLNAQQVKKWMDSSPVHAVFGFRLIKTALEEAEEIVKNIRQNNPGIEVRAL